MEERYEETSMGGDGIKNCSGLHPELEVSKYRPYQEAWHQLRCEKPGVIARIQACVEEYFPGGANLRRSPLLAQNARNGASGSFENSHGPVLGWRRGSRRWLFWRRLNSALSC
jgi:hypothetical protein